MTDHRKRLNRSTGKRRDKARPQQPAPTSKAAPTPEQAVERSGSVAGPDDMVALQRAVGNQAVAKMARPSSPSASTSNSTSQRVMRSPSPGPARSLPSPTAVPGRRSLTPQVRREPETDANAGGYEELEQQVQAALGAAGRAEHRQELLSPLAISFGGVYETMQKQATKAPSWLQDTSQMAQAVETWDKRAKDLAPTARVRASMAEDKLKTLKGRKPSEKLLKQVDAESVERLTKRAQEAAGEVDAAAQAVVSYAKVLQQFVQQANEPNLARYLTRYLTPLMRDLATGAPPVNKSLPQPKLDGEKAKSRGRRALEKTEGFLGHDVTGGVLGVAGKVGDYFGIGKAGPSYGNVVKPGSEPTIGGSGGSHWMGGDIAKLGGSLGVGVNALTGLVGAKDSLKNMGKAGASQAELGQYRKHYESGQRELFAAVELVKRKRDAALKGAAEGSGGFLAGVNGVINGIATLANSGALAAVTFGIGAAFGVLTETIAGIRDAFAVYKRHRARAATRNVIQAYESLLAARQSELEAMFARGETDVSALKAAGETIEKTTKMLQALKLSERKQGFKGKIFGSGGHFVAAAGAAALLAGTIGGVAASATPVGWVLGGVALVAGLSFAIGMAVKRSLRASNVKRMNVEKLFVQEYIANGTVKGQAQGAYDAKGNLITSPDDNAERTPDQRAEDVWHRFIVEPEGDKDVVKKGWFNRLTSKKKSGKLTMGERQDELNAYLAKHDTGQAGDTIWEGYKAALLTDEGKVMVDNPKYREKGKGARLPRKVTLRETIEDLVAHFFGKGKVQDFKAAMQAGGKREQEAKKLMLQKMKVQK